MTAQKHTVWSYKLVDKPRAMSFSGVACTKAEAERAVGMHFEPARIEWVKPASSVNCDSGAPNNGRRHRKRTTNPVCNHGKQGRGI